jgi:hypothetical protein
MKTLIYMGIPAARIFVVAAAFTASSCVASSQKADLEIAVPTDTIDTCRAGGAGISGVNSLFSSGTTGSVRLGMTECQLVKVLGQPSQVLRDAGLVQNPLVVAPGTAGAPASAAPAAISAGQRRITLVYASELGRATGYRFVDNALKEISRM